MNNQSQELYKLAKDGLVIRGMLAPDLFGHLTIDIELHFAWIFPTATQDKMIELKAELLLSDVEFGFANASGAAMTVRSLAEFDELVIHGWKNDWWAKEEWSDNHRVLVLAAMLRDGSDVRAKHQSTLPFVIAMSMLKATIEARGYQELGLTEEAWKIIVRCLNEFLIKNVKHVFQVAGVL